VSPKTRARCRRGIRWDTVDGNDPIASYKKLSEAMNYIRTERRPFCLEAYASRLHGHSSSSGGLRNKDEPDCIEMFEQRLVAAGVMTQAEQADIRQAEVDRSLEDLKRVREEPDPDPSTIFDHTFVEH